MNHSVVSILVATTSLLFGLAACSPAQKMMQPKPATTGIDISFTGQQVADSVFVTIAPIPTDTSLLLREYITEIRSGRTISLPVSDGKVHITSDSLPSVYNIICDIYAFPAIYLRPGEHVQASISNLSPLKYEISGLPYSQDIPDSEEFFDLKFKLWKLRRKDYSEEEFHANSERMSALLDTIMVRVDPETATSTLSLLDDDLVARFFHKLPAGAEKTLKYSHCCALRNNGRLEASHQQKLDTDLHENATVDFKLHSLTGEEFDVASLRGKWVLLDFWVSWCGPCRRGFDELKKVYADYSDRFEVVAICCGDHTEVWQQLVDELALPWTNHLAAAPESGDGTVGGFPVTAYPTKILIDPSGQLHEYHIGEDPAFYPHLITLLTGK